MFSRDGEAPDPVVQSRYREMPPDLFLHQALWVRACEALFVVNKGGAVAATYNLDEVGSKGGVNFNPVAVLFL